jgi:hypothetical protein
MHAFNYKYMHAFNLQIYRHSCIPVSHNFVSCRQDASNSSWNACNSRWDACNSRWDACNSRWDACNSMHTNTLSTWTHTFTHTQTPVSTKIHSAHVCIHSCTLISCVHVTYMQTNTICSYTHTRIRNSVYAFCLHIHTCIQTITVYTHTHIQALYK